MKTLRLRASRPSDVRRAASLLKRGGLVAFATETVYGLGADAFNPRAVLKIFRAKKRPMFDPLIVHLDRRSRLEEVARGISPLARRLAGRFWPGGLTIVVPKSERVPDVVTAGLSTVAVRMPSHPAARKLLAAFGGPLAAPSANRFGRTSPTTARDALEDLGGRIDAVLDGGRSGIGVESTIVWPQNNEIFVLRPGAVSAEELAKIAPVRLAYANVSPPDPVRPDGVRGEVLSPGGLPTHYAPRTPMALLPKNWAAQTRRIERAAPAGARLGFLLFKPARVRSARVTAVWVLSRKGSLEEAASNLFYAMRNLDRMRLDAILAAPVPLRGVGRAIADRLEKAASGRRADDRFYQELFRTK